MEETANRSVITFATNKLSYVQFALNCAQSILLKNDIPVFIVSNLDFNIPLKFRKNVFVIPAKPEHASLGIGIKLYIDEYVQTEYTLFIDSDCLCFGSLDGIFKACDGMAVTVAGNIVPSANWCGTQQAATIKNNFGIDNLIRFNGGLYFIKKSSLTNSIFDKAREIAVKYDEYGFQRINNKWINEEGPLSIAMILNNQKPIADDGTFMTDLYTDTQPKLNVLKGIRTLKNPLFPSPQNRPWYPQNYSPIILHFGGNGLNSYPYNSQRLLLYLNNNNMPSTLANACAKILTHSPYTLFNWLIGCIKKLKTK